MASKFIVFFVAASMLFGAGCSKNRGWLSRKDYSEMQDPFMEPESELAESSERKSKAAGRSSLQDQDPAIADGRARVPRSDMTTDGMAGPKPIRQAGASNGMVENGRRVSPATYPEENDETLDTEGNRTQKTAGVKSYSGPALSDFLQKKNAAARDAATEALTEFDQLPTRTASAANAEARSSMNPAATHAALPTISPEAESFSNFLTDKSNRVADSAQKANQHVQDASDDVTNFASWAEQQKAEWSDSASTARETMSAAPSQAKEKVGSVFEQANQASREMAESMLEPRFEDAGIDAATPLIRRPSSASAAPTLSKAKAPAVNNFTADDPSFADSFEEFNSGGSTATSAKSQKPTAASATSRSQSTAGSLDDSFRMDTGWKPAHMTHP